MAQINHQHEQNNDWIDSKEQFEDAVEAPGNTNRSQSRGVIDTERIDDQGSTLCVDH